MDNYIVSARKYRPQTFDTVVGQEHITTTLKNAIRNKHIAHAYLFCGPRGVGKTTCARIFAKTINCENLTANMEACGECPTCRSFTNSASFNIFELDAASNNSVDDIRELTNQVRFAPQQGKYKVYIIDEVHMLSASAFNAFLKTLEEPPPYAIFILATTEKHKILPTILSRCQIFDFRRITTHDIVAHLQDIAGKENITAQEAALHVIAQKSEGCMRDALSMLDRIASFTDGMLTYSSTMEHLNLLDADFYFRLTDHLLAQDVSGTLLMLDNALEKGFEGDVIINGLSEHLRNLLLCKDSRMAKLLDVPNDHKPIYYEKANQTPPSFILSSLNVLNDSELQYKNATNKRLHVEMCLIKLCYVLQAVSGAQIASDANKEVKKNSNSIATATIPTPQPVAGIVSESSPNTYAKSTNTLNGNGHEANNSLSSATSDAQLKAPQPSPPQTIIIKATANTTKDGANRKLSKNILTEHERAVSNASPDNTKEKKELTPEIAGKIFEKYRQMMNVEGKGMVHAQFMQMKIEMLPPDEIRIISPSDLTNTYAKEHRNALMDFYLKEAQLKVRLRTEMREDKANAGQQPTVLSKSETFDAMVKKNPELGKLKEKLNLQIEY